MREVSLKVSFEKKELSENKLFKKNFVKKFSLETRKKLFL